MSNPKTLLIDIETSPIIGYTWGIYDQNVISVIQPVKIICAAWKFLDDKGVVVKSLSDYEGYTGGIVDDKALVTELWSVLDEADIVVAHNGDAFDIKIMNTRFIAHELNAPSEYQAVDTLKVAKKYFRFGANKLDILGKYLDEGRKKGTGGFETWVRCMEGDLKAWRTMKIYNAQDIELLERVYLRLRPFMKNHPNLNTISPIKTKSQSPVCTVCQSTNTIKRGFKVTKGGRYQRYQCNDCGSWSSGNYERVK